MCEPTTMLAIAGTAMSFVGQQQQQRQQNKYNNQLAKNANESARFEYESLARQESEINDAATQDIIGQRIDHLKAEATAKVSAGEAGVSGLSVDSLIADIGGKAGRAESATNMNRTSQLNQNADERKAVYLKTKGRRRQNTNNTLANGAAAAIGIGDAAYGYYKGQK